MVRMSVLEAIADLTGVVENALMDDEDLLSIKNAIGELINAMRLSHGEIEVLEQLI